LEKISTRKSRFKTTKQNLAKETLNKDLAVCIFSCFAFLAPYNYYALPNRCLSSPDSEEILFPGGCFNLFQLVRQSTCLRITNSCVQRSPSIVLLKKTSGASAIAFIKRGNSEDIRFDAGDTAENISNRYQSLTTGVGTGSSEHQAMKYFVLMLKLLLSLEF